MRYSSAVFAQNKRPKGRPGIVLGGRTMVRTDRQANGIKKCARAMRKFAAIVTSRVATTDPFERARASYGCKIACASILEC